MASPPTPGYLDLHAVRAHRLAAAQQCVDHLTGSGKWSLAPGANAAKDESWHWQTQQAAARSALPCPMHTLDTQQARSFLAGHHVMVIGDLAARFWYAALVHLLNGTRNEEVADGYPMHKSACWDPVKTRRGGYDFSGWGALAASDTNPLLRDAHLTPVQHSPYFHRSPHGRPQGTSPRSPLATSASTAGGPARSTT